MIYILAISISLLLFCLVDIAYAQDFAATGAYTHMGTGGGVIGTGTGVTSLIQSNNKSKEIGKIWNKLTQIETQNATQDGQKNMLNDQMGRVEYDLKRAIDKIDSIGNKMQTLEIRFATAEGAITQTPFPRNPHSPPHHQEPEL